LNDFIIVRFKLLLCYYVILGVKLQLFFELTSILVIKICGKVYFLHPTAVI
jgi:hypothetical protein